MPDREILERIDRRLDQGDELIASCRDALERNSQAFERMTAVFDRFEERFDRFEERFDRFDEREEQRIAQLQRFAEREETSNAFIADMVRRVEVAGQRSDALFEHMIGRLDALTEAVMRVLDRLDGGTATA
ncbi:MAG: hypothetical protein ACRDK5_08150 [Solirubrobacterales bacterium]